MPIALHTITPPDWPRLRTIRLAALRHDPEAFWNLYEHERALSDADWQARARQWSNGETSTALLAVDDAADPPRDVGLVGGWIDPKRGRQVELVALWVEPAARGRGVATMLIDAVEAWARHVGSRSVRLGVGDFNTAARRLYEARGYSASGATEPHPHFAHVTEIELIKTLAEP